MKLRNFNLTIVLPKKRRNSWINPQPQIWGPRRLPKHAKWRFIDLLQIKRSKKAKIPWAINSPPFTWPSHKKPKHATYHPPVRYKHKKVAAVLSIAPAAPVFIPCRKKRHAAYHSPIRYKHKKIAALLALAPAAPVFIPFKRRTKRVNLKYRHKPIRRTNTAIIGNISTLVLAQKQWIWNPQAPTETFNIALTTTAWNWNKQTFSLASNIILTAKNWVWNPQAFTETFNIALTRQQWVWSGRAFITNLKTTGRVIQAFMVSLNRFMNRF